MDLTFSWPFAKLAAPAAPEKDGYAQTPSTRPTRNPKQACLQRILNGIDSLFIERGQQDKFGIERVAELVKGLKFVLNKSMIQLA